jgi:Holliday junction resolvasome RuvABC endonuclease subunit
MTVERRPSALRMPDPHTTRVLGVDPGLTRCGVGVVGDGRDVSCVGVTMVRTPAGAALAARLLAVADTVDEWLGLHRPDAVAVQRSQRSSATATDTALARKRRAHLAAAPARTVRATAWGAAANGAKW